MQCSRRPDSWTRVRALHGCAVSFVLIIAIVFLIRTEQHIPVKPYKTSRGCNGFQLMTGGYSYTNPSRLGTKICRGWWWSLFYLTRTSLQEINWVTLQELLNTISFNFSFCKEKCKQPTDHTIGAANVAELFWSNLIGCGWEQKCVETAHPVFGLFCCFF